MGWEAPDSSIAFHMAPIRARPAVPPCVPTRLDWSVTCISRSRRRPKYRVHSRYGHPAGHLRPSTPSRPRILPQQDDPAMRIRNIDRQHQGLFSPSRTCRYPMIGPRWERVCPVLSCRCPIRVGLLPPRHRTTEGSSPTARRRDHPGKGPRSKILNRALGS